MGADVHKGPGALTRAITTRLEWERSLEGKLHSQRLQRFGLWFPFKDMGVIGRIQCYWIIFFFLFS